ncbi:hypothetical protein TVAG_004720 [Trichomonas vaginalis G3]|uniref:Uncharacterized protein n=1 Tax=Trichomonas vaginalis (strain ATCC PRA-98 / G3) TaxID=412133 RepID=A2DT34_TRIV3|nr:hypothetical protein TVAGG3_0648780 [Trichomonas vaginalis G3]EAY16441.1 hypothetical protein TVAG_004720 [Trichomonas vaginalis G3]KAI5505693.1 hypothetical protein TVAGG3_0648780 [Trichomonas vaginalis G3]|eukprot:XP_001328664.1 hypothetical protein [Trichomonas vaginalis G3]
MIFLLNLIALVNSRVWEGRIGFLYDKIDNIERDYSTTDLLSLVDQISNDFHLERDRVEAYLGRSRHASYAKQLFNRIDFNLRSNYRRAVYLGGTVIKITKTNGVYTVICRQVSINAILCPGNWLNSFNINSEYEVSVPNIFLGIAWNDPLSAAQITQIYYDLNRKIEAKLNAYKAI